MLVPERPMFRGQHMVRGPISMVVVGAIFPDHVRLVAGGPRVFEKRPAEEAVSWLTDFGHGQRRGDIQRRQRKS